LAKADGMGLVPPVQMLKMVLRALKVRDIDELLADVLDDDGNFVDPNTTAGDVAANAFRNGQDPAAALK
jgi:hypothetical protein